MGVKSARRPTTKLTYKQSPEERERKPYRYLAGKASQEER